MDYVNAFWVGGLICALVQILMEKTKMLPGRIMVLLCVLAHCLERYRSMNRLWNSRVRVPAYRCSVSEMYCEGVKEAVDQ